MSLDWNIEQIKNHKTVCFIDTDEKDSDGKPLRRMNPVTHALIFATISVKLGAITEKNAAEFYGRYKLVEKVDGPFVTKGDGEPYLLTVADIEAHVGLYCNVSNESRAKFLSSLGRDIDWRASDYKRAIEAAKLAEEAAA